MIEGHADLIEAIGGGTRVAEMLTEAGAPVDREAVYKWKSNGVPWKYRNVVARLAEKAEKPLPPGFLGDEIAADVRSA